MIHFFKQLLLASLFFISLITSVGSIASESEVAVGTISCNAQWNEFCEDQKTISVPEGHKLCKYTITAKEKTGDSSYALVSTDSKSVTIKFQAKGNRDRFKQQSASIVLSVSLLGVRDDVECSSGTVATTPIATSTTPSVEQKPAAQPVAVSQPAPKPEPKTETPITAASATTTAIAPVEPILKPHACACSQWIDADRVTNCLVNGHGRDNVTCDSFATTIQCVATRDECRESQKEDCFQVMGLNQTTSQKRIFVADSPYCNKKMPAAPQAEKAPVKK